MTEQLNGKKIAILSAEGFEQSELFEPKKALEEAGAEIQIISLKSGEIKGWNENNWGKSIAVDSVIDDVNPEDFDALMIPGGVMNPDKLRKEDSVVEFVTAFMKSGKPIGAICHGPQVLIETKLLRGRKMTSYPSLRTDLENAGVEWVDEEVVADQGLVTSRKPADIPAFSKKLIEEIREGVHAQRQNNEVLQQPTPSFH